MGEPEGRRLGFLESMQYTFLRRFFPNGNNSPRMDGSSYAGKSKIRVLLGDELVESLGRCGTVIDFGCGVGTDALEVARLGCRHVIGVDIQQNLLDQAQEKAIAAGLSERVSFSTTARSESADAIVSLDAFEHFGEPDEILKIMHDALRPGGRVYASFGPTWYHPLGGHLFSVFPWAHLVLSERALCTWRSHFRNDGATRFSEVSGGLNQMTIRRFESLVAESPLQLERLECVPIRAVRAAHNRATREFTTAVVRTVLLRP